jgi:hypothetical protein
LVCFFAEEECMTRTSKGATVMQNTVSEPTPLYEYPPVRKQMSPEDVALCQQAIELANSGQKQAAYELFCSLHNHGNTDDVTLLYWIAFTTPSLAEAQRALETIARLEPSHPRLRELQAYVDRKEERERRQRQEEQEKQAAFHVGRPVPIIECPHCHGRAPAVLKRKVATGGWVLFACLLTGLLVSLFVGLVIPVPINDTAGMLAFLGLVAVFGFPLCFLALLIQEEYQVCGFCGIKLG